MTRPDSDNVKQSHVWWQTITLLSRDAIIMTVSQTITITLTSAINVDCVHIF